jgi:hypothetical protein
MLFGSSFRVRLDQARKAGTELLRPEGTWLPQTGHRNSSAGDPNPLQSLCELLSVTPPHPTVILRHSNLNLRRVILHREDLNEACSRVVVTVFLDVRIPMSLLPYRWKPGKIGEEHGGQPSVFVERLFSRVE